MASQSSGPSTNILGLVNSTIELPTMPEVLVKLNEVMARADASAADVAKVVGADPAVATNVLRIVNSAYYGLQVRVSSVSLAISVMGFNMTKKVALKAAVFSAFGKRRDKIQHFDPLVFWKHAVFTGVAARTLAGASSVFADMHPEDAYIAGLLHDIGKMLLVTYLNDASKGASFQGSAVEFERATIGIDHTEAGALVTAKWNLAADIQDAIKSHHEVAPTAVTRGAAVVRLADAVAHEKGIGYLPGRSPAVAVLPQDLQVLGLDDASWSVMRDALMVTVDEAVAALGNLSA